MVLACAVEDVVNGDTAMLASTLNVAKTSISLDLQEAPGIAAWEERMLHSSSFHRRACAYQRDQLLKGLELTKSCPYTIQGLADRGMNCCGFFSPAKWSWIIHCD